MTSINLIIWAAAAFTLLAFLSRNLQLLRSAAVCASVSFIVYAAATSTWPVLALHAVMLPVNLLRLLEMRRQRDISGDTRCRSLTSPGRIICKASSRDALRRLLRLAAAALVLLCAAAPVTAAPALGYVDRMHVRAVHSFRQAQFPEAYGRFIELANAGHPASARYALWMCQNGTALFGSDWDCASHEMHDWTMYSGLHRPQAIATSPQVRPASMKAARP